MAAVVRGLYGYSPDLAFMQGLDAEALADRLAALGATVVFGGYDDRALAAALRARGVRVMAEFGCFVGQEWWDCFRDSHPLLPDGAPLAPDGQYCGVNPAHIKLRVALLQQLGELLDRFPLDGLWLDFIRWPCHWEAPAPPLPETSFDAATVNAFCRERRLPSLGEGAAAARVLLGPQREAWLAWRCARVTSFAAKAAALVRTLQPACLVGAFTVPWTRDDWDGALTRIVGQDLPALAPHIDVFSPMVYHRMCGQPPAWIATVCADQRAAAGRPIWPIIQAVDEPAGLTAGDYQAALATALAAGEGALVFNLHGLEDETRRTLTAAAFGGASL